MSIHKFSITEYIYYIYSVLLVEYYYGAITLTLHLLVSFDLQELFATALDFLKLEKVELGGSRGKVLSEMVFSISEEFHDHWRTLRENKYDPLNYTEDVRPKHFGDIVCDFL